VQAQTIATCNSDCNHNLLFPSKCDRFSIELAFFHRCVDIVDKIVRRVTCHEHKLTAVALIFWDGTLLVTTTNNCKERHA
jgi:hypothetical protein